MSGYLRTPTVFNRVSPGQVFFGREGRYTRMSSSLLSAMVRRLLLDRIEATIYSWTVSRDSRNAAMHAHVAAFPYLDVTKISIRHPCLNFAVYSSHMLPRRLRRLDVLLLQSIKVHTRAGKTAKQNHLHTRSWHSSNVKHTHRRRVSNCITHTLYLGQSDCQNLHQTTGTVSLPV